ncbi:MAG TPA: class I SAM-dependent methyltransferase [Gemmatimonadaceae bacterium]|nr:class I SAM-dependent methyltransferase [Gemmatimonadaceae bacterium]
MSLADVRRNFDRFAVLDADRDRGLGPHERAGLASLPRGLERALDVGCGTGAVSRALSAQSRTVVGIDVSTETLALARRRTPRNAPVHFMLADAHSLPFSDSSFDCIVSVATLHHLEAQHALAEWVRVLRPGGSLLVIDVLERPGLRHLPTNVVAWLAKQASNLARSGSFRAARALHAFWREHGREEHHPTLGEARAIYGRMLPGAAIRGHLMWRYSMRWQRPSGGPGAAAGAGTVGLMDSGANPQ